MPSVIDEYVAEVGRGLRGPARLRRDMLAEIRDALTDAAEADGVETAVAEFGPAREIAGGLQEVLTVAHARRTALLLILVLGTSWAQAALAGLDGWPQWQGAAPGAGYLWLAEAVDLLSGVSLAAAAAAVVLLGWGARHLWRPAELARLVAGVTMGVMALTALGGLLLTALSPHGELSGAALWWAVPFTLVQVSAVRTWRTARAG
ncbi:HAAS signaling domain-containing protein [Catenuloplanes atrovinosus]|uniref:Uncharacterized protein n=1 Tax=Catenuloplanes atrovinosus TaxID=137266 RepID=A0AAE3YXI7_9ACTN|nr:hypothetical protein [Catenuloplanes atrovinosus]MDR7281017.1 hypothetical protein [Catenuloplanes atrovinosus]